MAKLSKTQREVLEKMARGEKLALWRDFHNPSAFLMTSQDRVRLNTVWKLHDLGYFKVTNSDWRRTIYTISAAGKRMLEGRK